jgi:KaiC/GvpD/RAD55 family RecA-like ATPase
MAAVRILGVATALADADGRLAQGHNLLAFGPPAVGKTHLIAGIGHALIDHGYKVLFVRTSDLVQRLQTARRGLRLPNELAKLDRFNLIDPGRSQLCEARSSRDLRAVRAHRRAIREEAHRHHGQRTVLSVGRDLPRKRP